MYETKKETIARRLRRIFQQSPMMMMTQQQQALWKLSRGGLKARELTVLRRLIKIVIITITIYYLLNNIFGFGTMKGGKLGQYLDARLVRYNMRTSFAHRQEELMKLGIELPVLDIRNNRFIKEIPSPFGFLAERMILTTQNENKIQQAEDFAEHWQKTCPKKSSTLSSSSSSSSSIPSIPNQILHPLIGNRYRELVHPNLTLITFDEGDIDRFIQHRFPEIYMKFTAEKDNSLRAQLFSLCSLYWYGGYIFNNFASDDATVLLKDTQTTLSDTTSCIHRAVIYVTHNHESTRYPPVAMLAATPRHPSLLCIIQSISSINNDDSFDLNQMIISSLLPGDQLVTNLDSEIHLNDRNVAFYMCNNPNNAESCNERGNILPDYQKTAPSNCQQLLTFRNLRDNSPVEIDSEDVLKLPFQAEVDISSIVIPVAKAPKIRIEESLRKDYAWPNWLCNRCLRTKLYGSFEACSFVCNKRYVESQCRSNVNQNVQHSASLKVQEHRASGAASTIIPKIIHQTWHSDVTLDRYPELNRLQNGWRASGFQFRFYNDTEARSYVEKNFPPFFLECYDAIVPGAFKADLFRLLVLLKDGGIYADVDVQLETTLDSLLTADMSLFIPRETIRDLAGADYCLWNGLIGSTPGHPVIVKAVERLLTSIATRADYFDVERYVCSLNGRSSPIWKLRTLPTLILSGPCALGMAMNEVLGRDVLSDFHPGWISETQKGKDDIPSTDGMLILMADKKDMGHFRFSDVERNILVASTDMPDMSKNSFIKDSQVVSNQLRPHYSATEHAADVYGTQGVYADDRAIKNPISFKYVG